MIAETVSLGILSLPSVLAAIGLVPGVILIASLGILATYTGYVFWQFKMEYPWVRVILLTAYLGIGGAPLRWSLN
jgi:amino acid permease